MPQLNGAPHSAQRDSAGALAVCIAGDVCHGDAQEAKLVTDVAAALADRQVHAQGHALAEGERAVFAL
jgi:hypothetical protein